MFDRVLLKPVRRRALVAGMAATGLFAVLTAAAQPASASSIGFTYTAKGTSTVAKTGSTVTLGPATLSIRVQGTGYFSGTLPFKPTQTSLKTAGLVPVTATVSFIPHGKLTGRLVANPKPHVTSTAAYYLKLSNVTVGGVDSMVGTTCQTVDPVVIKVATPAGGSFNLGSGGVLKGTYVIGTFAGCGLLQTPLVNSMVPGSGNTVTLRLSNGHAVP